MNTENYLKKEKIWKKEEREFEEYEREYGENME